MAKKFIGFDLEKEQIEWLRQQPGGMSETVRRLIDTAMEREARRKGLAEWEEEVKE